MSTAQADPIATLRASLSMIIDSFPAGKAATALAELERRANIEARRDAFGGISRHHPPNSDVDFHLIELLAMPSGVWHIGRGTDYHTALEAALNAAGAP